MGVPARLLARGPWTLASHGIETTLRDDEFEGGPQATLLRQQAELAWPEIAARARAQGRPFFGHRTEPPGLLRVNDCDLDTEGRLHLDLSPTWFWAVIGSNYYPHDRRAPALYESERTSIDDLGGSLLANPLTVNVVVVAQGEMLVQRVGGALRDAGSTENIWQCSAAGYVDRADANGPWPAPWVASLREAREETSLELEASKLIHVALARHAQQFHLGILSVYDLPSRPPSDMIRPALDEGEVAAYEWWPFDPEAVASRIAAAGGWRSFRGIGGAAVAAALADRFGDEAVVNAFAKRGG